MPPDFEVSVSNLEFSQTRYGREFQRLPPKFSSSKKYSREPFNFPLNTQFSIWSLIRCASPRCCCLSPVHYITQDLGCCQDKSIYISTASLQELTELGKYECFFRVYHNNETDQGTVDLGLGWIKVKRPIILGSSPAKVPYRSSPPGQHLELLFVFLQYIFRLLVCLAVNGLEIYLLVTSVARDTSFMLYPLLSRCNLFPMSSGKGFPGSKNPPNWSYWWYLVGLNCTGNLNFSSEFWRSRWAVFGILKFHFRFSSLRSPGIMLSAIAQSLSLRCWYSKSGGHAPSVLAVNVF